jgi:hypothetical protein
MRSDVSLAGPSVSGAASASQPHAVRLPIPNLSQGSTPDPSPLKGDKNRNNTQNTLKNP